jgi:Putative sensor
MTPVGAMAAGALGVDPEGMTTTALNVPVPQAWIRRLGRDTLYLTFGLATSILALAVWITGLSITLSLAVFIVGLPAALVTAIVFRWTVELDRRNAALVFGAPVKARYRDHSGPILVRLSRTFRDPQTWKDLGWLITHSVLGMAFGIVAVTLIAYTLGAATLPLWYWSISDGVDFGFMNIDTLPEALGVMLLAAPLAVISAVLVRLMARAHSLLALLLLG